MTTSDILNYRLANQQINDTAFTQPQQLIRWLGAMQSQMYGMAKWAIGLRLPGLTDTDVEHFFNKGAIIRTHVLRPTWHFVAPDDIRWMLQLTAPRVKAINATMYRKVGLDERTLNSSNDTLIKTLQGGKQLTRLSIKSALEKEGISADGLRLGYILMHAELDGIICSGPRAGRQFTYALLEERIPPAKPLEREESLAELANRYFTSRGPATVNDFVWWSGLTVKEAKEAVEMLPSHFIHEEINGKEYLFAPASSIKSKKNNTALLLPDYDEYGISYKDRSAIFINKASGGGLDGKPVSDHIIVIDGKIAGTWKQTIKANRKAISIVVETSLYAPNKTKQQAVLQAVKRYISFVDGANRK